MEHCGTRLLESERLLLRPFRSTDAADCLKNWASDPAIYRYISGQPQTIQEITRWLSSAEKAYASPETYYWAIEDKASRMVIGEIYVDDFSDRNCWCELSWKIGSAFQGKNFAFEASQVVIRYLTGVQPGFHRIQAKCCVENLASERVMQKLGMAQEGLLHGYFLDHKNQWQDVVVYGLVFGKTPTV